MVIFYLLSFSLCIFLASNIHFNISLYNLLLASSSVISPTLNGLPITDVTYPFLSYLPYSPYGTNVASDLDANDTVPNLNGNNKLLSYYFLVTFFSFTNLSKYESVLYKLSLNSSLVILLSFNNCFKKSTCVTDTILLLAIL